MFHIAFCDRCDACRPGRRVSRPALGASAFEAEAEARPHLEPDELAHHLVTVRVGLGFRLGIGLGSGIGLG